MSMSSKLTLWPNYANRVRRSHIKRLLGIDFGRTVPASSGRVLRRCSPRLLRISPLVLVTRHYLSTSALPLPPKSSLMTMRRYTRRQAELSGPTLSIRSLIKHIMTNGEYKRIFQRKTAGGVREHRVALLLDVSASMMGHASHGAAEALVCLISALIKLNMKNFLVLTFGTDVRLIKSDVDDWNEVAMLRVLSEIHPSKFQQSCSLATDAVESAVDLLCTARGGGDMVAFVLTDGYGTRGIRLSQALVRAEEVGVKVIGVGMGYEDTGVHSSYQHWVTAVDTSALPEALRALYDPAGNAGHEFKNMKTEQTVLEEISEHIENPWQVTNPKQYYGRMVGRIDELRKVHLQVSLAQEFSVDVMFVMDCTGSMRKLMAAAKDQILQMQEQLIQKLGNKGRAAIVRMGFVAYRDFDGSPGGGDYALGGIKVHKLTKNVASVRKLIQEQEPCGGGDGPEDIAGGIECCLQSKWKAKARFVVLVADAPCHGLKYHDFGDDESYPDGDPKGRDIEQMLRQLSSDGDPPTKLLFVKLRSDTDKMIEVFNGPACCDGKITELELGSPEGFGEIIAGEIETVIFDSDLFF
mmetsp:Transcript_21172/g.45964  ORF Transcript_21172/g.45964 Transcript_21172/m.45964 type:complete len:580 (+) Transcript_21172:3227-4966(+)